MNRFMRFDRLLVTAIAPSKVRLAARDDGRPAPPCR